MRLRLLPLGVIMVLTGAAIFLGWLFGLPELTVLAVGAATAAVLAAIELRFGRVGPHLDVTVTPRAVTRGSEARLDLVFTNEGSRSSRPALVSGHFGTAGNGLVAIAPLDPGADTTVSLRIPTHSRGTVSFGPLFVRTSDPLRIWRQTRKVGIETVLLVHPRVHPIAAVSGPSSERVPTGHLTAAIHGGADAEVDLVGLRPYVAGDDLRRIHWRTSARRNEPHVVQVEPPVGPAPIVIVVDTRAQASDAELFELSIEAAASVATAAARLGRPLRLTTTSAGAPRTTDDARTLELAEVLDTLATVQQSRGGDLLTQLVGVMAPGHTVVLCTGDPGAVSDPRVAASTTLVVHWDGTTNLDQVVGPRPGGRNASGATR